MYAGAASGAVTIGLALVLIVLSQKPNASETSTQPEPEPPAAETPPAKPPALQAAVVLPPPPVASPGPPAGSPRTERAPLKPRTGGVPAETVEIKPLKPRPQPVPADAASPAAPEPVSAPGDAPPARVAALPRADPAPRPNAGPVAATPQTVTEGRALLKMLETGKGPVIEIAWPQQPADRSRLYRLLTACYGMQTAILANGGALYVTDSEPGQAWQVNRDTVSGFIRKPSGMTTEAERSIVTRIRNRHGIAAGDTVRLFPRGVDAVMLGGLGRIVGPGYLKYSTIRARYRLVGDRITVVDLRVDGIGRPGQVALPRARRCNP